METCPHFGTFVLLLLLPRISASKLPSCLYIVASPLKNFFKKNFNLLPSGTFYFSSLLYFVSHLSSMLYILHSILVFCLLHQQNIWFTRVESFAPFISTRDSAWYAKYSVVIAAKYSVVIAHGSLLSFLSFYCNSHLPTKDIR